MSPVTSTEWIVSSGVTAPVFFSSAFTLMLPVVTITVVRVAGTVVPMCASTVGPTVAVAFGEPTRTTPPPEAVPVASASPRPVAVTVTSPEIGTG